MSNYFLIYQVSLYHPTPLKSVTRGTKLQSKENKIFYLWEHSVQLDYSIDQQDILNSLSCTPDECSC